MKCSLFHVTDSEPVTVNVSHSVLNVLKNKNPKPTDGTSPPLFTILICILSHIHNSDPQTLFEKLLQMHALNAQLHRVHLVSL